MTTVSRIRRLFYWAAASGVLCAGVDVQGAVEIGAGSATLQSLQSLQSIRAAAEDFVRGQMPRDTHGITVKAGDLDPRLRFVRCEKPLEASLVSGAQLQARMAVGVSCKASSHWTVFIPVTIESEIPVLVLRTSAARGAHLTENDVAVETRRVSGLAAGYVTDIKGLERSTLRLPLPAGAVLTGDLLERDFIVKQGEQVMLLASASGIEVRAAGKALENGREGARIRVQNLASLKVVEGVVDASRVIHVTP